MCLNIFQYVLFSFVCFNLKLCLVGIKSWFNLMGFIWDFMFVGIEIFSLWDSASIICKGVEIKVSNPECWLIWPEALGKNARLSISHDVVLGLLLTLWYHMWFFLRHNWDLITSTSQIQVGLFDQLIVSGKLIECTFFYNHWIARLHHWIVKWMLKIERARLFWHFPKLKGAHLNCDVGILFTWAFS